MKKYLFLLLMVLWSPALYAATSFFEPSPNDQSILLLGSLFGEVSSVLEYGGSELLKGILIEFNNAVLVLGGIIIIYSLVVSTLNTAHEGEMLGRDWNSIWIPIRAAGGFALLLPVKASGYALIQVFVMWVIVQGVGAADALWTLGINKIQTGTAAFVPTASVSVYNAAENMFLSKVCQKQVASYLMTTPRDIGSPNVTPQLMFGVNGIPKGDICGAINFKFPASTAIDKANNSATAAMVNRINGAADIYIRGYSTGELTLATQYSIQNIIRSAAETYNATLTSFAQSQNSGGLSSNINQKLEQSKQAGWISAGSYFLDISQAANENMVASVAGPSTAGPIAEDLQKYLFPADFDRLLKMLDFAKKEDVSIPSDKTIKDENGIWDFIYNTIVGPISKAYLGMLKTWQGWMTGDVGESPILAIQSFGTTVANVTAIGYLGFVLAISAIKAIAGSAAAVATWGTAASIPFVGDILIGAANLAYITISTVIAYVSPAVILVVSALFLSGLMMGYYVPLIPYIVFTLSAIGWLILAIEAMVAAPLMAIGVLHPEGQHKVLGKAEAGIMILAGVFLRPGLMIIGFFASILLSYAAIGLLNMGFLPAAQNIVGISPFGIIMVIVIYTVLTLIVINRAFSLIHYLPDRIMRWLGQPAEQTSVESELQQVRGGAEKAGGDISKGMTGVGDVKKARMQEDEESRKGKAKETPKGRGGGLSGGR